jgi:hypothetical protein
MGARVIIKNLIIIYGLFILIANDCFALSYYSFDYKVENNESYTDIVKRFVKEESIVNAQTPFVEITTKNNPTIRDWENIMKGNIIKLTFSDDFLELNNYNQYKKEVLEKKQQELEDKYPFTSKLKGSLFYMSSLGDFNEKSDTVGEINFKQNSPVTLGLAFSYLPLNKPYSISTSAYFSYLTTPQNSLNNEPVKITPEIGANIYGEYFFQKYQSILYAGPDFEKFSTFNMPGLENDGKVYVDGVQVVYMTFGYAKSFSMWNKKFFTKASIAKSALTYYSSSAPLSSIDATPQTADKNYSITRYLLYLNYKYSDKLYFHTLFKYHSMTGSIQLSSFRIGFGIGYILF